MTNTEYLYGAMLKYQQARSAARDEYFKVMRPLESAKGSDYYKEQRDKAAKKRGEAVSAAQAEARRVVDNALACMRNAVSGRKMVAPTQEQLNILTVIKMRENITHAELQAAANAMDGNGAALAVLSEVARNKNLPGGGFENMATGGLSADAATTVIRELTNACAERIDDTVGANRPSVQAARYNARAYGKEFDPDDLPQETPYSGEADFYGRLVNIPFDILSKSLND